MPQEIAEEGKTVMVVMIAIYIITIILIAWEFNYCAEMAMNKALRILHKTKAEIKEVTNKQKTLLPPQIVIYIFPGVNTLISLIMLFITPQIIDRAAQELINKYNEEISRVSEEKNII